MTIRHRSLRLLATTLVVVVMGGAVVAPVAAELSTPSGFAAVSGARIDSDLVLFFVNEAEQGSTDLNGDGDASDHVAHIWNRSTNAFINLELAVRSLNVNAGFDAGFSDGVAAFVVSEAAQGGTDLNGDGDADDFVVHVWQAATGTVANLGVAVNPDFGMPIAVSGGGVMFLVSEAAQGADLNGDGDMLDYVWHTWRAGEGLTNLGLTRLSNQQEPVVQGSLFAFSVEETGTDLNGDGDTFDTVVHAWNAATGIIANSGLATSLAGQFALSGGLVGIYVHEGPQGNTDLNGDGDTNDAVLHIWNPGTGTITNSQIGTLHGWLEPLGDGGFIWAVTESAQGDVDLNGDGDTNDHVVHVWPTGGPPLNLGVATSTTIGRAAADGAAIFVVPESAQGNTDLNGDGDINDHVVHGWSATTGLRNLGLAVGTLAFATAGGVAAFLVREAEHGNTDLNGDGDASDWVVHTWDVASDTVTNLGLAAVSTTGGQMSVRADDGIVAFLVSEAEQGGTDINGNGSAFDAVVHLRHPDGALEHLDDAGVHAGDSFGNLVVGDGHLLFRVTESGANVDLNGDGDMTDTVLVGYQLDDAAEPISHDLFITRGVGGAQGTVEPSPREAGPLVSVSVGEWQTCGIRTDGSLACGEADFGDPVDPPTGTFTAVAVGDLHSCAIRTDSTLECWGTDVLGSTDPPAGNFTMLSAGSAHTCAIATTGEVTCWGRHFEGQTGAPPGTFSAVSAGFAHTCAIRADSTLVCWGEDGSGQSDAPTGNFLAVGAGMFHTCAIHSDGSLECWGDNSEGQLEAPSGSHTAVSSGAWHSCAIGADGTLSCWGNDFAGQATPYTGTFSAISSGENRNCGIRSDELLLCWGDGSLLNEVPWIYEHGTEVALTAVPEPGFVHIGWSSEECDEAGTVCVVIMDQDRNIGVVFSEEAANTHTLDVILDGDGGGHVGSDPAGIDCEPTCSAAFIEDTVVELTATAEPGSTFAGWSGDCSGTDPVCLVTMDDDRSVTATFDLDAPPPVTHTLDVTLAGDGAGHVGSDPAGIDCEPTCSAEFEEDTIVELAPTPDSDSTFDGWTGDCGVVVGSSCFVTMSQARSVTATFDLDPTPPADEADLRVTQVDTPDPVTGGNLVKYDITVFNDGPDDATGVTLTDTLPSDTAFVSADTSQGACDHLAGVVTCSLGSLTSGDSASLSVVVSTPSVSAPVTIVNEVTIAGDQHDPLPANNSSLESTLVEPADADPDVASGWITADGGTVSTGGPRGPSARDPMTTSVTVPPGYEGLVTISEGPITSCPAGFVCFGQEAFITAPTTTPSEPLRLTFTYHPSTVPGATKAADFVVFHDDVLVERCADQTGVASPDPCILSVEKVKGRYEVNVLTSSNGRWKGGR